MKIALLSACFLGVALLPIRASVPAEYTPGLSFGKADNLRNICAVAVGPDDTLVVAADGRIRFFDPATAKATRSFATGVARADALATDGTTIFLLISEWEQKTATVNGRKVLQQAANGVRCKRFTWAGEPLPDLALSARNASAAKMAGGELFIADFAARAVRIFDASTGKETGKIGRDVRLCCGIFDVNVDRGNVLLANLGAFKVQRYDAGGKLLNEWGRRGSADGDFQGCCNPVSVAALPNGNVVTVEKEPSRVKVYTADGKLLQVLPNLENLVEGCDRVSLAVDSKGRVYLGVNAKKHFVVQYVPRTQLAAVTP